MSPNPIETIQRSPLELVTSALKSDSTIPNDLSKVVKQLIDPVLQVNKEQHKDTILDEIYIDGLDSHQVWEQAKLVIENNVDDLMFNQIPELLQNESGLESESESDGLESQLESESDVEETELPEDNELFDDLSDQVPEKNDESEKSENESDLGVEAEKSENEDDDMENDVDSKNLQESTEKKGKSSGNDDGFGLNDEFFNLEDFKKQVLAAEEDLSDDEEIDYNAEVGAVSDEEKDEELDYYDDFFAKPVAKSSGSKKQLFDDENDDEESDEEQHEEYMASALNDMYEEGTGQESEGLSTYEKQQLEIQKQIEALEKEAISEKKWTMKGEASVRNRPEDALLDEELEFDRNAKPVPVITQEATETIEELIRRRIKNAQFDDIPRRTFQDVTNKKFKQEDFNLEEAGKKSQKSLAELYEDENIHGFTASTVENEQLQKKHDEIISMYQSVAYKLDSLCSAHFIPKPATKQLEVRVNTSAIQMEEAQPLTMSTEDQLAPQEVFKAKRKSTKDEITSSSGMIMSKEELSKEEKSRIRRKAKRRKMNEKKKS